MDSFLARYGVMLAFLILAIVGGYAIEQSAKNSAKADARQLYEAQIQACEKRNDIRNESNKRIRDHTIERDVLEEFLADARDARRASGSPTDKKAASRYANLKKELEGVRFSVLPFEDCAATIQKP